MVSNDEKFKFMHLSKTSVGSVPRIRCSVHLPIEGIESNVMAYTFYGLSDGLEHLALSIGNFQSNDAPLVRLHSECLTGDVFGSCKCDCGPQLHESLLRMQNESGIVLYMRQEGRGIGLYNKIDTYALQEKGFDTYEANRLLNFPDDLRNYTSAVEMLFALEIKRIRLLSNNPLKAQQFRNLGIEVVEQLPTRTYVNQHNIRYLKAKIDVTKHTMFLRKSRR